jgi:L-Ala-D/L-Glu epimerase
MSDLVKSIHLHEVTRPLRVRFATSLGAKDIIRSIIVRVTLRDGSFGLGECPTSSAFRNETIPVMMARLSEWTHVFVGTPSGDWKEKIARLRRDNETCPMALSGLETALFRASLMTEGVSEHSYWGGKLKQVETDITVPFIPGDPSLSRWIDYGVRKGFRVYKIKVSGDLAQDKRFILTLCHALGERVPGFTVRLDGNQGYTSESFLSMIDYLEKGDYRIELFEQPLPRDDFRGFKEIKGRSPIPVILDETVVTGEQMSRAADMGLCHGVNIKIAKSGIQESLHIARIARESGLKLMIGCMTETMVGLSAGIYFASGFGAFDYVDLDGIYFLHHRNRYGAMQIKGPRFILD